MLTLFSHLFFLYTYSQFVFLFYFVSCSHAIFIFLFLSVSTKLEPTITCYWFYIYAAVLILPYYSSLSIDVLIYLGNAASVLILITILKEIYPWTLRVSRLLYSLIGWYQTPCYLYQYGSHLLAYSHFIVHLHIREVTNCL